MFDEAVRLYHLASSCFRQIDPHQGGRLVLSLYFKALLGIERIFHFDSLRDVGFALLTGGQRALSRNTLGSLVRAVSAQAVNRFVQLTRPALSAAQTLYLSLDEHVIPRFTRKFLIPKGFHTIRNKKMRAEKLFFIFDTFSRTLIDLVVTPGSNGLACIALKMLSDVRARHPSGLLRVILDAGAALSNRELLEVADQNPDQVLLVRTPRRPAYVKKWNSLPKELFIAYEEPGRYKGAPAKRIHVTETTTSLRAGKIAAKAKTQPPAAQAQEGQGPHASQDTPSREVRTIVVREEGRKGKDRWHAIFVFRDNSTPPLDIVKEFRTRQHHEQTYRILLHDNAVDAAPSGYNKKSRNPDRPGFRKGALTLYSWLAGLAANALLAFSLLLPEKFKRAHPRTLRRWWLNFPADLYLTDKALCVVLYPHKFRDWWEQHIKQLNAKKTRVPWLSDRLVVYSLGNPAQQKAELPCAPSEAASGVWC